MDGGPQVLTSSPTLVGGSAAAHQRIAACRSLAGATLTVEDDRQDYGEDRFITVGFLDATMVVLVWTPRDGAHRIISIEESQ